MMNRDYQAGLIVMICGILGVIVAYILYELDARGILVDELTTGTITAADVMAVTIIVFLLAGLVMGARR